jgi:hypothetical protein
MLVILLVAVFGKLVGCGLAALGSGMDWVRSLRIGCGMVSRGEVGLIVTAMGASTGIFGRSEVAVMVAVVLLTTLLTPIALRGAFHLRSSQDIEEGLETTGSGQATGYKPDSPLESSVPRNSPGGTPPKDASYRVALPRGTGILSFSPSGVPSDAQ